MRNQCILLLSANYQSLVADSFPTADIGLSEFPGLRLIGQARPANYRPPQLSVALHIGPCWPGSSD